MAHRYFFVSLGILALTLALVANWSADALGETITVRSGDVVGPPGTADPVVTMLVHPPDGWFPDPFTPADFAAATAGPHAAVTSTNIAWLQSLPSDPSARWINDTGISETGSGALYSVPVMLSDAFDVATLHVFFMADDGLGHAPYLPPYDTRAGIYVNGVPLEGSNTGGFYSEYEFQAEVSGLLGQGENHVYFYNYDLGSDSGVFFSLTITTSEIPNATETTTWGGVKASYR